MPARRRRGFGGLRKLPSGRWQAYYSGPDGLRHLAPETFTVKIDGEAWLAAERRLIERDEWRPPAARRVATHGATLVQYAPGALERRRVRGQPLRPRTLALYRSQLDRLVLPGLGELPLRGITGEVVRRWHDNLPAGKPTQRAHAYSLLRTLLGQAVDEGLLRENPAKIRGAGTTRRVRDISTATPAEVQAIAEAIVPGRLRLFVLLAAWCGMRYGELAELRRRDIDVEKGTVRVDRQGYRVVD